jgi:uncharacterized OB-fold protein
MRTGMADVPFRILPELGERNRRFWQAGGDGRLEFLRCTACGTLVHPPAPVCPRDYGTSLAWSPVSGRARVATFTVNHQPWMPGPALPYVVAIVELEEQPDVRLMTNVVGCAPDQVRIGMPVRVLFEHHADARGDVWIPLFEPDVEPNVEPDRGPRT